MRKWSCIVDGDIIWCVGSIDKYFLVLILGEGSLPYSLFWRHFSSENNWRPALGRRHYCSSARDMISSSVTNQWLPTIKTIQPSKYLSTEEKPFQFFSWIQLIFLSANNYCISHINYFLISFTGIEAFIPFYISISTASCYLLSLRLYPTKNSENIGSTYLQQWLVLRWIISNLISFIFNKFAIIKYLICSSHLLLYHFF